MKQSKIEETLLKIAKGQERDVYCLKQFIGENFKGEMEYINWWLDVNTIFGFRIPILDDGTECPDTVNIDVESIDGHITIKREPKIIEYLTKNFVEKCK